MFGTKTAQMETEVSHGDGKTLRRYFAELGEILTHRRRDPRAEMSAPASFAMATMIVGKTLDLAAHMAAAQQWREVAPCGDDGYPQLFTETAAQFAARVERERQREQLAKQWRGGDDVVLQIVGEQSIRQIASDRASRKSRAAAQAHEAKHGPTNLLGRKLIRAEHQPTPAKPIDSAPVTREQAMRNRGLTKTGSAWS